MLLAGTGNGVVHVVDVFRERPLVYFQAEIGEGVELFFNICRVAISGSVTALG
jgi:hypothetical protein